MTRFISLGYDFDARYYKFLVLLDKSTNSIPFEISRERARRSRQRIVSSVNGVGFGFLGNKPLLCIFIDIRSINVAGSRCTRNIILGGEFW